MTEEELRQKCKERAKIFQQAMESCHSSSPMDCIEWFADRISELEAQIEKMKCCGNCANLCGCGIRGYEECKNLDKWELREIKEK